MNQFLLYNHISQTGKFLLLMFFFDLLIIPLYSSREISAKATSKNGKRQAK